MAKGMSFKVLMQLQTKEFQKGIRNIQKQLNGFKNFMKSAFALGSITMFGRQLVQVGKDFENAMARVQAVSNATQEEFRKMSAEAQRLGSTTRYTATEAAEALENLTRNGMSAANATKALSGVLQLAQANSIGLADAANIVTNTLNMFNLGVEQTGRVNDVLSSTASHAATDINLLYEAMVNAAPAANVLGFSIEEVSSAIGALAQRGVKGAEAGTKLRIAFQKMADPKVIGKMHDYGIQVDENTMKTEGLRKTVEKISKANLSLGELGKIFDAKSAMAVQMLVASLDDLDRMLDVTANSAGETARMFDQSVGSVQKELDTLKSMYEGLLISISQKTSGAVKSVVKLLQNLIDNFNSVGGTIRNIAVVAVPLLSGRVVKLASTMRTAFAQIAAGATTVKAALGGWVSIIATLVTWVGSALWGAWDRATRAMRDANKQMSEANIESARMQETVGKLIDKIGDGSNADSLNYVVKKATELFPQFADAINNAKRIAEKTGEWDKLKTVLQDIADLQDLVMKRDAQQSLADARAQRVGAQMYNDTTFGLFSSSKERMENAAALSIRRQLVENNIVDASDKDTIKKIFAEIARRYGSKQDAYEGLKEVEKFLEAYDVEIDYDSLARWLNKYNSDFIGGPTNNKTRQSTQDLKDVNSSIARADSAIVAKQFKIYNDEFENFRQNEENSLKKREQSQAEYNKKMYDAAQKFYNDVLNIEGINPEGDLMKQARDIASMYPAPKVPKTTPSGGEGGSGGSTKAVKTDADHIKDAIEDYNDGVTKLNNRLSSGTITQKEYEDELDKLEDKTWEAITAFSNFSDILAQLGQTDFGTSLGSKYQDNRVKNAADAIAKQLAELSKYTVPKRPERDTKRDYVKTKEQIAEEEVKVQFDYAEALQKLVDDFQAAIDNGDFSLVKEDAIEMLDTLRTEALKAADAADTLQAKLDLSEAITKLDDQIKGLNQTAFDTFQSVAQAMDRVMQGLMSIAEVFDEDVKDSPLFQGIEAFASVMNSGIQIMQATMSVLELVNQMKNTSAKNTVKNAAMEVAANEAATVSATKKAAAEATAAAAGGASSVAGIPFVGPALAVAAAASIAAALLAAFSKFESGGIVGGNSFTGDHNIIRANSGEMILNKSQQGTLWNMLNGKGGVGGGNVEFRIRGADLIGVIDNEQSRRRG